MTNNKKFDILKTQIEDSDTVKLTDLHRKVKVDSMTKCIKNLQLANLGGAEFSHTIILNKLNTKISRG